MCSNQKTFKNAIRESSQFFPNRSAIARQAFRFALCNRSAQDTSLACLPDSVGLRFDGLLGGGGQANPVLLEAQPLR